MLLQRVFDMPDEGGVVHQVDHIVGGGAGVGLKPTRDFQSFSERRVRVLLELAVAAAAMAEDEEGNASLHLNAVSHLPSASQGRPRRFRSQLCRYPTNDRM